MRMFNFKNLLLIVLLNSNFLYAEIKREVCSEFTLESNNQTVSLEKGTTQYFNISVCDPVQVFSSDESIITVERFTTEFIDEIGVTAVSNGSATATVSDKNGVGYLFINVIDSTKTTTNDKTDTIWFEEEPDGYFSWFEANKWCEDKGYRLPYMSELITVWNANGGQKSPSGFKKDTFYWAIEEVSDGQHKGCAMDYDCSTDDGFGWSDNSFGHPKCVMSTPINTNNTNDSTLTIDSSVIEELGDGWHLLGNSSIINDFGIFNSAKIIWFYDFDKGWQNFTPTQSTPPEIDIKNFQGFWVKK